MKHHKPITATRWIEELLGQGRYTFSREEAQKRLGTKPAATYMVLRRLEKESRLAMPKAGFYTIVDPQHRSTGILPPDWFVHALMGNMGKPYYVGLLSAAQIHGAAHHRPQEFQVVIPTSEIRPRTIHIKNVRIRFFSKSPFEKSGVIQVKTPTGYQRVSTPETTAWDLVRYYKSAGGYENVITVLSELSEHMNAGVLQKTVKQHGDMLVARRLGYLLDHLGRKNLVQGLAGWVGKKNVPLRLLDPSDPITKSTVSKKWRLLVNVKLESET